MVRQVSAGFGGYDDPKLTLAEALSDLGKKYDLSIDVAEDAFKA